MVDTRIMQVEVLPGYRVRLMFRDGTQGQVDLTDHVAKGVFSRLSDHAEFAKVRVSEPERVNKNETARCSIYCRFSSVVGSVGFGGLIQTVVG